MNTTLTLAAVHESAHCLVCWSVGGKVLSVSCTDRPECVRHELPPATWEKLVDGLAIRLAGIAWETMARGGVPEEVSSHAGDLDSARAFGERYFLDCGRAIDEKELANALEEGFKKALRIVEEEQEALWELAALIQRVGRLPGPNCERFLRGLRRLRTHEHEPAGRTAGDVDRARAGVG